jgi:hypothetical protein
MRLAARGRRGSFRTVKRWLLLLLPAPFLVALAAWASACVADRVGATAARALGVVAVLLRSPAPEAPALEESVVPTDLVEPYQPLAAPPAKSKKWGAKGQPSGPPVVFISRDAVLSLASTGARPRGVPVAATAFRPAGLKLLGVAALSVGLRDGDVLTRALGVPALSSSAVIQAVLAARARRASVLEGEFWRGNQRWIIRVEQPYLPDRQSERVAEDGPRLTLRETRPRLGSP